MVGRRIHLCSVTQVGRNGALEAVINKLYMGVSFLPELQVCDEVLVFYPELVLK